LRIGRCLNSGKPRVNSAEPFVALCSSGIEAAFRIRPSG
jgi:hypothetical protein